ncbi:MAG TPA: hypothetical protein VFQ65_20175 [Kofleriaceae bacterium]|nr:hypothetical protein [Kofleriaceae bacterium]
MVTRWDELAAAFDRLAGAFAIEGRDELAAVVARSGWGHRPIAAPLLPSGVRHGVPWSLSVALGEHTHVRVWLEAQADPPSPPAYLAAARAMLGSSPWIAEPQRLWHQLVFARGRAPVVQTYACVPDRPELAWAALGAAGHGLRAALPARARVTMLAHDHERVKLYVLVPEAQVADVPGLDDDARSFAQLVHPRDAPIGWLVAYTLAPAPAVALHFAAHVHGDRELPARLAATLPAAYVQARSALGDPALHFVAHAPGKCNVYFIPEVAR